MRRLLAIIVTLALGLSSPAFGDMIVMEKGYYDATKSSFDSDCAQLYHEANTSFIDMRSWLDSIQTRIYNDRGNVWQINQTLSDVITRSSGYANENVGSVALAKLRGTYNLSTATYNDLDEMYTVLNDYKSSLTSNQTKVLNDIIVVSNSFPVAVSTTNLTLNVYVVVTNSVEECTNQLADIQIAYTNFLNYYEGAGNQVLNQYRATVTNLLNWSEFQNWVDNSRWLWGNQVNSDYTIPYNMAWDSVTWSPTAFFSYGYVFDSGVQGVKRWTPFWYRLPDDMSYADYLMFTLQGIHDSLEHVGKIAHSDYYGLFATAATNSVMTYTFNNSQTNNIVKFLTAESSYDKQVNKIATTRNLYQRFEHWISYIARSVSKDDVEINDDATRAQDLETMANDAQEQAESISNEFAIVQQRTSSTLAVMTNTWSSIANLLSPFVPEDKPSRTLRAANDDPGIKIMSTQFVGDRLRDLTKKGNDVPNSLILSDTVFNDALGNEVQKIEVVSKMSKLKEICHITFGIIWMLLFFTIAFFECLYFMKTAINLWWRALRFIPDVSRYMFGN